MRRKPPPQRPSSVGGGGTRGTAGRVAEVHRQTRPTLAIAAAFAVAAPVAAVFPHRGGSWLPLHLFLVGGVLSAISGATQFFAVTWSAAPAPARSLAALQRWLLVVGVVGLATTRELGAPVWAICLAGSFVLAALILLGGLLVQNQGRAVLDRFRPAIEAYVAAVVLGVAGGVGGVVLASGAGDRDYAGLRMAHLTVNLLGLVGLVIAGTVPYMIATQARTKISTRATPRAVRALVAVLGASVLSASAGYLVGCPRLVAGGLAVYAAGLLALLSLLPPLGRRQIGWAGPRLLQLLAGMVWWVVAVALMAVSALNGEIDRRADQLVPVLVLVIGGYAQILTASFAYLAPVLRGGGHRRLTAGFAATRSWPALASGNVAVVAVLTHQRAVLVVALGVWLVDTIHRVTRLLRIN